MKRLSLLVAACLLLVGLTAHAQGFPSELTATITTADGQEIGIISFGTITPEMASDMQPPMEGLEGSVVIWAQVEGLTPGFHGFHIHSVGTCDPAGERAFASAGGHLHEEGQTHGGHIGDLPSLRANANGAAVMVVTTDGFTLADLLDEDGSAVIIHGEADNFGNIPADRYDPDADETTLNTGDAGGRVGCGIITGSS
jgi:Cu-Zn family superoxide dismutase